jgi:hypothetical protein
MKMSKAFDSELSLKLDRALLAKEKAKTPVAKIFYAWRLRRLEKNIPWRKE